LSGRLAAAASGVVGLLRSEAPATTGLRLDASAAGLRPSAGEAGLLRVTEIFHSIQGETSRSGLPCAFVRFTGCDLRCGYCDTAYAFQGGSAMTREAIVEKLLAWPTRFVTLTGGEPLLQKELPDLARDLLAHGFTVAVETHGQLSLKGLPAEVIKIVDVKTPGSGEVAKDLSILAELEPKDEVKFVVCSRADFDWSLALIREHRLESRLPLLLSPSFEQVAPKDLAAWMIETGLQARLNLQIHKYIWGAEARGV
jgi:7-carboxy-7-deazaguanine synthase